MLQKLSLPGRAIARAQFILVAYSILTTAVAGLTLAVTPMGPWLRLAGVVAIAVLIAGWLFDYRRREISSAGLVYEVPAVIALGAIVGPGYAIATIFACLYVRSLSTSFRGAFGLAAVYFCAHLISAQLTPDPTYFSEVSVSVTLMPTFLLSTLGVWGLATALSGGERSQHREELLRDASERLAAATETAQIGKIVVKAGEALGSSASATLKLVGADSSVGAGRRDVVIPVPTQSSSDWTLVVVNEYAMDPEEFASLEALAAAAALAIDRLHSELTLERRVEELAFAEQFLSELHQRNEAILNSVSEGVVGIDAEGRVIFMNDASSRFLGQEPGATLGGNVHSILRPTNTDIGDVISYEEWAIVGALRTGESTTAGDESFCRADGVSFPVDYTVTAVCRAGVLSGIVVTFRDITKRRQTERHLLQFAALVESSEDAIIGTTPEGIIQSWNPGAVKLLKRAPVEAIGTQFADLFPDEEGQAKADLLRTGVDGEAMQAEVSAIRADGGHIDVSLSVAPIRDATGAIAGLSTIVRDITERRQIEEAERASQAKSEFLSRMSHELRTPLNAILGFGQLLGMQKLDAGQQDKVHQILRAGDHLLGLINEVLDISRIESGGVPISIEPVQVGSILAGVIDLVAPLSADRGITIDVDHETVETHVAADQQRFKQVLLNLLSNAIKYNRPEGRVTVGCHLDEKGRVAINVTDTGRGIAPHMLPRLFRPFDRLDADADGIEGSGLGLALSKGLVEVMNGDVTVSSEQGVGTTFTVHLPAADKPAYDATAAVAEFAAYVEAADDAAETAATVGEPAALGTSKIRVLCIEDNVSNLKLVQQIFAARPNVELLSAQQGTMGYELARQHLPDLILLDVNLPDTTGDIVLDKIRADELTEDIPVIVLSADATAAQIKKLLSKGAQRYLTKPLDVRRLLQAFDETLATLSPTTKD